MTNNVSATLAGHLCICQPVCPNSCPPVFLSHVSCLCELQSAVCVGVCWGGAIAFFLCVRLAVCFDSVWFNGAGLPEASDPVNQLKPQ